MRGVVPALAQLPEQASLAAQEGAVRVRGAVVASAAAARAACRAALVHPSGR